MPRENARTKADRLLLEGRVVILEAGRYGVVAKVRGEGHVYRTAWQFGAWSCDCPARTPNCSHLHALRRVTCVDLSGRGQR